MVVRVEEWDCLVQRVLVEPNRIVHQRSIKFAAAKLPYQRHAALQTSVARKPGRPPLHTELYMGCGQVGRLLRACPRDFGGRGNLQETDLA